MSTSHTQLFRASQALATALNEPDSDHLRAVDFANRALSAARFRY